MEEGSVLVKNADNALPLKTSERNVTLFGYGSAHPPYRGSAGGNQNKIGASLYSALKEYGFDINDTVHNALYALGVNYQGYYDYVKTGSTSQSMLGRIGEVPVSFYAPLQCRYNCAE